MRDQTKKKTLIDSKLKGNKPSNFNIKGVNRKGSRNKKNLENSKNNFKLDTQDFVDLIGSSKTVVRQQFKEDPYPTNF